MAGTGDTSESTARGPKLQLIGVADETVGTPVGAGVVKVKPITRVCEEAIPTKP